MMENEHDSELGKLLLEGEKGGLFYFQIFILFLVGFMLVCGLIVNIFLSFGRSFSTENLVINVIFCLICLFFAAGAFLNGKMNTEIKMQIFENGFQYCDEKVLFRDVKKFRYIQGKGSGNARSNSFDFTMNDQQEKSFITVGWSNESLLADLLKKKVIGQL